MRELPLAGHDAAGPRDMDDGLDAALLTALRHLPDRQREVIALIQAGALLTCTSIPDSGPAGH